MCLHKLQEVLMPCELQGGSNIGFSSPGALWWNRAALELQRSWRAMAQAPLCGEAGMGRASTGKGWLSPGRLKAPPGSCKMVRRESGAPEGPGKFSWGQQGRPCCGIRGVGLNNKCWLGSGILHHEDSRSKRLGGEEKKQRYEIGAYEENNTVSSGDEVQLRHPPFTEPMRWLRDY
ncbi:hypothetical protein NDU88_007077 [Pleurodeles waltl]|uniref:Uncharacterized protein n=1 Tax=Pleurodeles waltl TaxID=8319 RepID=A0AAV7N305_PLEWA|nr:hypothetical protein NDU88_007077 [Pleurodeles waltl]